MSTSRVSLAAAVLASVLAVAACGASATPAPSGSPSSAGAPAPSSAPSAAASEAPQASPSGAAVSPEPSIDLHGAPDLEARLPKRIGETDLTAVSLSGESFMATGGDASQSQLRDLLTQLGRTPKDLSVAEAHDPAGALVFQLGLFRVAGTEPEALASAWLAAQQAADGNRLKVSQESIAGHAVTHLQDPSREVGADTYVVAIGDTLVLVLADDHALVEEALADLG